MFKLRSVLATVIVAALFLTGFNSQVFAADNEGTFIGVHSPASGYALHAFFVAMEDETTIEGTVYSTTQLTALTSDLNGAFSDSPTGTDVTLTPGGTGEYTFSVTLDKGESVIFIGEDVMGIRLDSSSGLLNTMFPNSDATPEATLLFIRDRNQVAISVVNEDSENSLSLNSQIWARAASENAGAGPAGMFSDEADETAVFAAIERLANADDADVNTSISMTKNDGWLIRSGTWTINPLYALSVMADFDASTSHDLVLVWGDVQPIGYADNGGGNAGGTLSCSTAYVTGTSSLNIRTGAGVNYTRNGSLSRGDVVNIMNQSNGWSQIALDGWVSNAYLSCSAPTSPSNSGGNNNTGTGGTTTVRVINPIGDGGVVSVGSGEIAVVSVWCNGNGPRGAQDEMVFLIDDGTSADLHAGCNGSAWIYLRTNFEAARSEGRAHAARIGAPYTFDMAFQAVQDSWGLYFSN